MKKIFLAVFFAACLLVIALGVYAFGGDCERDCNEDYGICLAGCNGNNNCQASCSVVFSRCMDRCD